jgi:hypothetical protein
MNPEYKIKKLERLFEKSKNLKKEDSNDPDFKIWKDEVIRTLMQIYGDSSHPVKQFNTLRFYHYSVVLSTDINRDKLHLECFRKSFHLAKNYLKSLIEELQLELQEQETLEQGQIEAEKGIEKIFISHSSLDKEFVEEIIDLIETIGLASTCIFCSSFPGYGINLGENFLARLKDQLDENILVLFILSQNFYKSPISLCEMGATWVKTNEHIPILIPPFDFKDIQGVIPSTQGFQINDKLKLNLFKEKIEKTFNLRKIDNSIWERKRDRAVDRIEKLIA